MSETTALAEIEAGLPHTDAEYEAWARKEYPHVTALYDILVGKPAKSWPNLPDDIQAYLAQFAERAKAQDEPLWDGNPVNIPGWATRLYANAPESECPIGWRALLIYSGEIFKLDWPMNTQEDNVHPTLDGVRNAALVAGCSDEPDSAFGDTTLAALPCGYCEILTSTNALADIVLRYVAISSRVIGSAGYGKLATTTTASLVAIHQTDNVECSIHTRSQLLNILFDSREETLRILENDKETGTGCPYFRSRHSRKT